MTLSTQFLTILVMIGSGIYLGIAVTTYRRFDRYWKKNYIFTYTIEILFWLLQGLIIFYFLFLANQGELRLYVFLSILCGFAAYQALILTIYQKILEKIIHWVVTLLHFFRQIFQLFVYLPLKWVFEIIIKILVGLWIAAAWGLILIIKVLFFPFRIFGFLIWRLLPKNVRNYLLKIAGIYSKIKNIALKYGKHILGKRR